MDSINQRDCVPNPMNPISPQKMDMKMPLAATSDAVKHVQRHTGASGTPRSVGAPKSIRSTDTNQAKDGKVYCFKH